MNISQLAALAAASLATCALVSGTTHAQTTPTDPLAPAGAMTAFPTIVQTGTKPTLSWSIMHPARIGSGQTGSGGNGNGNSDGSENLAIVNPPGTIIPTTDAFVTVQIIGTGPTNCQGGNATTAPATDLRLSINGAAYDQLFYGTQLNIDPSKKLFIKKVLAGQTIDLGGRFVTSAATWSPFYTTRSRNLQVVALVNGDIYPAKSKFQGQAAMASYLKPYIDSSFKVNIGPLSVLLVMELAQTNLSSPCFDYQDQVVLVTLSRKHPNNGHGNNLDGVDSSNPGNGNGGPNGAIDPSGGVDDEIR
ncbi:MAG: hypothetical protein EOP87_13045 [Verrucomicrobiaceae bacterium]|nr:MAG: hypothetical protein EOP87_13045 [Verrucomicrobiaceae bacterium]